VAEAPPDFAAEMAALRAQLAKVKELTAFELLGVPDNANSAAIKIAYFKLAKQAHPDTVPPGAPEELAKLKASLFAEIGGAYRRIGDDESRAAYVEELKAGGSEVDVSRILQAEELFNRATLLVKARRFAEAAQILDEAIQNNPDEGEFYAWRGFARFFAVPDKAMARRAANQDLDEALRRNPKCVAAYYYLGQIAKLSNDPSSALRNFKKTVELNPNHIDAQRELRLLGKK
jgi:curved DNA-binding protein CbpA